MSPVAFFIDESLKYISDANFRGEIIRIRSNNDATIDNLPLCDVTGLIIQHPFDEQQHI